MRYIVILTVVFIIMLFAPFVGAIVYCHARKGKVLTIRQEKKKDARYFGKAFSEMVENNFDSMDEHTIQLSKKEKYINGDQAKEWEKEMDDLVICRERDFYIPNEVRVFNKEIYSTHSIVARGGQVTIRAAYAKEKMILGDAVTVDRWVDAEQTIAVYDNCDLGMSATAGKRLSVGMGCRFRRLFAPEILIGQYPDTKQKPMDNEKLYMLEAASSPEVVRNIKVVDHEMVNDRNEANITVLTEQNLTILEDFIVKGDICSHKGVRLCDNAVVCGNIFAEKDVRIGTGAVVLGNIFTQGSVFVEKNAMIGQPGKIVSVIAREKIRFEKNVFVYGFVSCEKNGKTMEKEEADIQKETQNQEETQNREYHFLELTKQSAEWLFDDLQEYKRMAEQGFRKEKELKTLEIRVPVRTIKKSFCFSCQALERVVLPGTIEDIGAYAFADCIHLKSITKFSDMQVKCIHTSAFENCEEIEELEFPKELQRLEGAAFAGCKNVKRIQFAEDSLLKEIGDHCFRGCAQLECMELPDSVEKVGISAFADCPALRKIQLPARCENEPGIVELKEKQGLTISFREEKQKEKKAI